MGVNLDMAQNTLQTTDDTQTSAVTYSLPQNSSGIVQIRVIGTDESQNTFCLEQIYAIKRDSGNGVLIGLPATPLNNFDTSLALASATLIVNGTSLELDVIGVLATTINWAVRIDIMYLN